MSILGQPLIAIEWHKPEARARAERWVAETSAELRPWARRAYVNYLPPSTPERIREIYGVNYPRLAQIKARYDPANLFRENQNIRPEVRSLRPGAEIRCSRLPAAKQTFRAKTSSLPLTRPPLADVLGPATTGPAASPPTSRLAPSTSWLDTRVRVLL